MYPSIEWIGYVTLGLSVLSLVLAALIFSFVLTRNKGSPEMADISRTIRNSALAFITFEYACLSLFVAAMVIIISLTLGWRSGVTFLAGSAASALAGFFGMLAATISNAPTAAAAETSLNKAMRIALSGGSVMGFAVVGLGLGGLSAILLAFREQAFSYALGALLAPFGFGCGAVSLFSRVGGGIFTKSADIGADLVGKLERSLPEDDPRNPAVIADAVGDNVGDVCGMGADLEGSFVGAIVAAILLGNQIFGLRGVAYPLWLAASGVVCSLLGVMLVRVPSNASSRALLWSFRLGLIVSAVLEIAFTCLITFLLSMPWVYLCIIAIGIAAGGLISLGTEFFTSSQYPMTQAITRSANISAANVIIQGLSVGMRSTLVPTVVTAATLVLSMVWAGAYGASLAAVGMLTCIAFTLATDAFGAISDNAGSIAEMAQLNDLVRQRTDILDALGNTTAATGKGFAIAAALLTGISLVNIFRVRIGLTQVDVISDPYAVAGVLVGAMLPFVFSSLLLSAVSRGAKAVILEVRRQIREFPGILTRVEEPNYRRLVMMLTLSSIRSMIGPALVAIVVPVCCGLWFTPSFLGGLLVANTACGFMLSTMSAVAGGAWDNSKKQIEAEDRKGSAAHKNAVIGDTVGDPLKDTSGPAINILIKLSNYSGLVLAPVFLSVGSQVWQGFVVAAVAAVLFIMCELMDRQRIKKSRNWINRKILKRTNELSSEDSVMDEPVGSADAVSSVPGVLPVFVAPRRPADAKFAGTELDEVSPVSPSLA